MPGQVRQPTGTIDMQPVQLPLQTHPRLVRVLHRTGGHQTGDAHDGRCEDLGGLLYPVSHGAIGDGAASQIQQGLARPRFGQQLILVQVYRQGAHLGAVLLPWSLRHITTCPIHRVFLVDHCSACRSPLTIVLSSGTCEHCNYALDRLPVQILDTTEENEELSHLPWSAVGCGDSSFPPDFPTLAMNHPLRQVQPAAFLQFLWHGGQLLLTRDPQNPLLKGLLVPQGISDRHDDGPMLLRQTGVQTVHTVLLAMWHLLKGWPQSWYGLLERLVSQEEPLETSASTCLPAVFTSLFPGDAFA